MKIFKVFNTKRFSITFISKMILFVIIGLLFSYFVSNSQSCIATYNNCEASYIAYDSRKFDENCYRYYGKDLHFNLSSGDSIRINCETYQFLDNVIYDNKSLINSKNVINGIYSILEPNQIAIPDYASHEYKVNIGDSLFLNGLFEYKIKYIFRNIGNIKEIKQNSTDVTIFIGKTNNPIQDKFKFAIFDNSTKDFNEVFLFLKGLLSLKKDIWVFTIIPTILFFFIQLISNIIFKKLEKKQLYKAAIGGSLSRYNQVLYGFNALLLLLPSIICSIIITFFGNYLIAICLAIISIALFISKTCFYKKIIN